MIRLNKAGNRHTIYNLKDDNLREIYLELKEGSKLKELIVNHLINCVTEEDLENSGVETPEEYIENYFS